MKLPCWVCICPKQLVIWLEGVYTMKLVGVAVTLGKVWPNTDWLLCDGDPWYGSLWQFPPMDSEGSFSRTSSSWLFVGAGFGGGVQFSSMFDISVSPLPPDLEDFRLVLFLLGNLGKFGHFSGWHLSVFFTAVWASWL